MALLMHLRQLPSCCLAICGITATAGWLGQQILQGEQHTGASSFAMISCVDLGATRLAAGTFPLADASIQAAG